MALDRASERAPGDCRDGLQSQCNVRANFGASVASNGRASQRTSERAWCDRRSKRQSELEGCSRVGTPSLRTRTDCDSVAVSILICALEHEHLQELIVELNYYGLAESVFGTL